MKITKAQIESLAYKMNKEAKACEAKRIQEFAKTKVIKDAAKDTMKAIRGIPEDIHDEVLYKFDRESKIESIALVLAKKRYKGHKARPIRDIEADIVIAAVTCKTIEEIEAKVMNLAEPALC